MEAPARPQQSGRDQARQAGQIRDLAKRREALVQRLAAAVDPDGTYAHRLAYGEIESLAGRHMHDPVRVNTENLMRVPEERGIGLVGARLLSGDHAVQRDAEQVEAA